MGEAYALKMWDFVEWLAKREIIMEEQQRQWTKATLENEQYGDLVCSRWGSFMMLPVAWGWMTEQTLFEKLAEFAELPLSREDEFANIDNEVISVLPLKVTREHEVVPLRREAQTLFVAIADPFNLLVQDDIHFLTGLIVKFQVATPSQIKTALDKFYSEEKSGDDIFTGLGQEEEPPFNIQKQIDLDELERCSTDAPVVRLVNLVLVDAIRRAASEIHVELYEKELRIRYRLDGALQEMMKPPLRLRDAMVSRIKIMANLDIVNRQTPQRGKIRLVLGRNKEVDFLVSTVPVLFGEKVVLKVLNQMTLFGPAMFSLTPEEMTVLCGKLAQHGLKLIYGLSGSGKTALISLLLGEMCDQWRGANVMAVGDVVMAGISLSGVNCMYLNETRGFDYAAAIENAVRDQSADVIVVGAVSDEKSARAIISATLTGKIVFCEVTVGSDKNAVNYLQSVSGDDPRLNLIEPLFIGTRLVRKLCGECRSAVCMDENMAKVLERVEFPKPGKMFQPRGCRCCNNTGYRGLIGVCEFKENDKVLGQSTKVKLSQLIEEGLTSLEEALR